MTEPLDDTSAFQPRLTTEELEAAMEVVRRPCPICGGTQWHSGAEQVLVLPSSADSEFRIYGHSDEEGALSFDGLVALPMICGDCGFIAQFAYRHLMERARAAE